MIRPLCEDAISQISTSVALQALSSFVKELLENSIDAGSTLIVVTFFESGRLGVQVSDNGWGIPVDQCGNLAVKGGTSKLDRWEDLSTVQTHGFRGEALNAISRLGELSIVSRFRDDAVGWRASFGGIESQQPEPVEREQGTTVKVTNLFQSLPVRRLDFEKTFKQQYNSAINVVTEYAIIQEAVEFRVSNIENQAARQVLISGRPCDLQQKIRNVLGDKIMQNLQAVEVIVDEWNSVRGFVSKSVDSGSTHIKKSLWYTYLNRRPINAPKSLLSLITRIYRQHNPKGHFVFILNFQAKEADFNVSVDKREVYFKNEERIAELLQNEIISKLESNREVGKTVTALSEHKKSDPRKSNGSQPQPVHQPKVVKESTPCPKRVTGGSSFLSQLQRSLSTKSTKKEIQTKSESEVVRGEEVRQYEQEQQQEQEQEQEHVAEVPETMKEIKKEEKFEAIQAVQGNKPGESSLVGTVLDYEIEKDEMILPSTMAFKKPNFRDLVVVGQFNKGFLVTFWETGRQILVIDQHACDEKSTFERLISKCKITATTLLAPFRVSLKKHELERLLQRKQEFEQLGMVFEIDDDLVVLKTLPSYGKTTFGIEAFNSLVEQLNDDSMKPLSVPGLRSVLAMQACRSSIMIGEELPEEKMKQMCERMSELESPWNCPHGRPTFLRLEQTSSKLERIKRGFSKIE